MMKEKMSDGTDVRFDNAAFFDDYRVILKQFD